MRPPSGPVNRRARASPRRSRSPWRRRPPRPTTCPPPSASPLALKLSRSLEIPARPATPAAGGVVPLVTGRDPARALSGERPRGAMFLRADRLEGDTTNVTAAGKVELRTQNADGARRLAALRPREPTRCWAKGNVVLRQGFDWITGPGAALQARRRDRRIHRRRASTSRRRTRAATRARSASRDPTSTRRATRRYTTCVAPSHDWYLRTEELEIDNAAQGRHGAPRDGRTSRTCRSSMRPGSSSRCRTSASPAS